MINILQTEIFRLKRGKLFWILLGVCALLPVLSSLLLLGLKVFLISQEGGALIALLDLNALDQLASFDAVSADSAVIAVICSAVVLCKEFTQGTMRNVILANKSRKEMFLSYFVIAMLIGMCYFVAEFAMTLLVYGLIVGFGEIVGGVAVTSVLCHFALGICAVLFSQTCVCLFMFATRSLAMTLIFPLIICLIVPEVLSGIINLILLGLSLTGKEVNDIALQCLPFYNLSELDARNPQGLCVGMIALYNLVFSAAFFCAGFFTFQKADLK